MGRVSLEKTAQYGKASLLNALLVLFDHGVLHRLADFEHRKEIGLYSLRDWILARWTATAKATDAERPILSSWDWL
jgi:hypothetical protein